jgi:hypothetical protein
MTAILSNRYPDPAGESVGAMRIIHIILIAERIKGSGGNTQSTKEKLTTKRQLIEYKTSFEMYLVALL